MSEQAIMIGYCAGSALLMWGSTVLSKSEDDLMNTIGMMLFSLSLIGVVGVFFVAYQIADNAAYTHLTDGTAAFLAVVSALVILYALFLLAQVFITLAKMIVSLGRRFLAKVRGERGGG